LEAVNVMTQLSDLHAWLGRTSDWVPV